MDMAIIWGPYSHKMWPGLAYTYTSAHECVAWSMTFSAADDNFFHRALLFHYASGVDQ